MNEVYELIEVYGKDNEIDEVKLAIHFYTDDKHAANIRTEKLMASIDKNSDKDTIIHCALNAIGSGDLKRLRNEMKKNLFKENGLDCYYNKNFIHIERVYVKLALIELDLWDSFEKCITSSTLTAKEKLFFSEAKYWNKKNVMVQQAFDESGLLNQIDEVYQLAFELSMQENMKDIFE